MKLRCLDNTTEENEIYESLINIYDEEPLALVHEALQDVVAKNL